MSQLSTYLTTPWTSTLSSQRRIQLVLSDLAFCLQRTHTFSVFLFFIYAAELLLNTIYCRVLLFFYSRMLSLNVIGFCIWPSNHSATAAHAYQGHQVPVQKQSSAFLHYDLNLEREEQLSWTTMRKRKSFAYGCFGQILMEQTSLCLDLAFLNHPQSVPIGLICPPQNNTSQLPEGTDIVRKYWF